jgi:uncharacterized membrane protein
MRQTSGKQKQTKRKTGVTIVAVVVAAAAFAIKGGIGGNAGGGTAVVKDADLVIPVSEISETARFYPVEANGTMLEVVAVKASDGTIRTAFNTCQVCYDSGKGYYEQDGDVLVCQNCGNRFRSDQVEVLSGGCNPIPIFPENKTVTDETVTISNAFLNEAAALFENWKTSVY